MKLNHFQNQFKTLFYTKKNELNAFVKIKEAFIKIEKITSNTKSGLGCNFLSFFYSILY